jgi:pimeloyl-ACP methyl ester carboxylesterase
MRVEHHNGWDYLESGPGSAEHAVLLLPGTLCTASFFEELMGEQKLRESSIRLVATTLPGYGGTAPTSDVSIEGYARQARGLATALGCDVALGHSTGANVALEMATGAGFAGPVILLSPSLSRGDEPSFPRAMDRLGSVLGSLPWSLALKIIGSAVKADIPKERHDALVAEMKKTDPRFLRRQYHSYLAYLDGVPGLAERLCASGVTASVAFGEHDDVAITDRERRVLEGCPRTTLTIIGGAGHLTITEKPGRIADLILAAISAPTEGRTRAA